MNRHSDRVWIEGYNILFLLLVLFVLSACAQSIQKGSRTPDSATLHIRIEGLASKEDRANQLVLHYLQYSLDGELVQASQIGKPFEKKFHIPPGRHHLHIETASRGIMGARAFLVGDGICYTFRVGTGETALFNGRALSTKVWKAKGFVNTRYTTRKCNAEKCR